MILTFLNYLITKKYHENKNRHSIPYPPNMYLRCLCLPRLWPSNLASCHTSIVIFYSLLSNQTYSGASQKTMEENTVLPSAILHCLSLNSF